MQTLTHDPLSIGRQALSPREMADVFGVSVRSVYAAVERKQVSGTRVGGRIVIPIKEVERLLGHRLIIDRHTEREAPPVMPAVGRTGGM